MSTTDELITGALRDLAAQAGPVPLAADALWRAGQRRRRRNVITLSATAAGAAAVAVVLALTLGGGRAAPAGHGGSPLGATRSPHLLTLSTPIQFRQVAGISAPPCGNGAYPMQGRTGATNSCVRFTGTGETIIRLESARVRRASPGRYQIDIRMTPADARRFGTLTRELAGQNPPRDQLAVVTNGYVLTDPRVLSAITGGRAAIGSFASKAQAYFVLATMTGG